MQCFKVQTVAIAESRLRGPYRGSTMLATKHVDHFTCKSIVAYNIIRYVLYVRYHGRVGGIDSWCALRTPTHAELTTWICTVHARVVVPLREDNPFSPREG